jgi:itaconyl-CoA hydratase
MNSMNRHASHIEVSPGVFRERMGLFFEDVVVGETYEHRPGKTFFASESAQHSLRALDQSPEFSESHFHDQAIGGAMTINPLHVLAVLTGMMTKTFSRIVANLAWTKVKFHHPVRDGDTLYAESTVREKRASKSRPGQGIIVVSTTAKTADGRVVCTFERSILIYARGQGPYAAAGY